MFGRNKCFLSEVTQLIESLQKNPPPEGVCGSSKNVNSFTWREPPSRTLLSMSDSLLWPRNNGCTGLKPQLGVVLSKAMMLLNKTGFERINDVDCWIENLLERARRNNVWSKMYWRNGQKDWSQMDERWWWWDIWEAYWWRLGWRRISLSEWTFLSYLRSPGWNQEQKAGCRVINLSQKLHLPIELFGALVINVQLFKFLIERLKRKKVFP